VISHAMALKLLATSDDPDAIIGLNKKSADSVAEYVSHLAKLAAGVEPCEITHAELIALVARINPNSTTAVKHMPFTRVMRETAYELFVGGLAADADDVAQFRWIMKEWDDKGTIPLKA